MVSLKMPKVQNEERALKAAKRGAKSLIMAKPSQEQDYQRPRKLGMIYFKF
jgi:hypothetical protein